MGALAGKKHTGGRGREDEELTCEAQVAVREEGELYQTL
jgi:hypothetical protein